MSSGRISHAVVTYAPRPDATPEAELSVLASLYGFVRDCHAKKEAVPENRLDDGTKTKEDSAHVSSLPQ